MKKSVAAFLIGGALLRCVSFASDSRPDVSQIIDKPAAESILGELVKAPTPRNGDGADGYYSKCNYYSATRGGKSLIIRLHLSAADAMGPQKELQLIAASSGPMQTIVGLGDSALMFSGGGESGVASRLLMLYVVKGDAFITIGLGGFADDTIALEKAKTVAQKVLEHL
jgi:hypothetical protein